MCGWGMGRWGVVEGGALLSCELGLGGVRRCIKLMGSGRGMNVLGGSWEGVGIEGVGVGAGVEEVVEVVEVEEVEEGVASKFVLLS